MLAPTTLIQHTAGSSTGKEEKKQIEKKEIKLPVWADNAIVSAENFRGPTKNKQISRQTTTTKPKSPRTTK